MNEVLAVGASVKFAQEPLYPGDMDRYADRLDSAAEDAGTARIRPEENDDKRAGE